MELIRISDSKIKLMLTSDDMASYTGSTREMLREIMHDACRKCGSTPIEGRLFIQMYPSRKGGCELFVTRLGERNGETTMREGEERTLTEYRPYPSRERHIVYSFETMNHLLGCCLGLLQLGYRGTSSAYIDRGRRNYYLLLVSETFIAGENFGKLCPSRTYYYINEHCDVICGEEAVEKLGRLA